MMYADEICINVIQWAPSIQRLERCYISTTFTQNAHPLTFRQKIFFPRASGYFLNWNNFALLITVEVFCLGFPWYVKLYYYLVPCTTLIKELEFINTNA